MSELPTDKILFALIADALGEQFGHVQIHTNTNKGTIRIRSISTDVIHEITVKRVN